MKTEKGIEIQRAKPFFDALIGEEEQKSEKSEGTETDQGSEGETSYPNPGS